jgi:hypothetical protein
VARPGRPRFKIKSQPAAAPPFSADTRVRANVYRVAVVVVVVSTTYKPAFMQFMLSRMVYTRTPLDHRTTVYPYVRVAIYFTYGHAQPCWVSRPASSLSCFLVSKRAYPHTRGAALLLCASPFCSVVYTVYMYSPIQIRVGALHTSIIPSSWLLLLLLLACERESSTREKGFLFRAAARLMQGREGKGKASARCVVMASCEASCSPTPRSYSSPTTSRIRSPICSCLRPGRPE